MKKQYIYSALILTALLTAGCAKEFENTIDSSDSAAIELTSVSTDPMTKAVITGTSFTTDEAAAGIGLFLLDGSGNAYGSNSGNVRYGYSDGKWTAASPLRIGNTEGTLVGYYPYSSTVTDITAIPVASSINGTDYLYGSIAGLTSANAKTEGLTLSHALTRLRITFKLDNSFVGDGILSSLTIEGDGVAASGTVDATSGAVTAAKSAFTVSGLNATITTVGLTEDCLVVPAAASDTPQAITLRFTVDGTGYKVDLKDDLAVKLQSGIQTDINLTVKNTSVTVDGSSIGAWGDGGTQTVSVGGDYTVTVKLAEVSGIEKDIMVTAYADGASVVIKAQAESGRPVECVLSDDKLCDFTKNKNIYTFTISDITSDLTATVGYTVVHSISLNKNALNLTKEYGHYRLVATVLPEEAEDKTLIWSSSDKSVATVDQNGYVKALATGSATITVETKVGGYTATCSVTVAEPQSRPDGALPGHFSVSDSTVVFFSKGNLYCSGATFKDDGTVSMLGATWGFETHQYDTTPSVDGDRAPNHISHFMWCNKAERAMALSYDSKWDGKSPFFAEKDFSVGGVNTWSTLTTDELRYLLNTRTMKNDVPRYTNIISGITIEGKNYIGLFIYPDDYDGMVVGEASETWTWENINDAEIVFLPAAGFRTGGNGNANVRSVGKHGYYWLASSPGGSNAFNLFLGDSYVISDVFINPRSQAYSVRLVTESK